MEGGWGCGGGSDEGMGAEAGTGVRVRTRMEGGLGGSMYGKKETVRVKGVGFWGS